jgi:F0F1-type ATP synthase assembly protein I
MARIEQPAKKVKEPNRIKQMWDVLQMTRKYDNRIIPYLLLGFIPPILVGLALGFFLPGASLLTEISYPIIGLLAGLLLVLIILGRRAERAAYSQIEGQAGAVGAVLKNSVRRGWQTSEMPVNVSPRTQDAVYRAIGRGGIALIGEGPKSRTQRMLDDERRTVLRVLPNVPVTFIYVGPDADSTPLYKLPSKLQRIKPSLRKPEVLAVSNRLASLTKPPIGIPKGIDPNRVRTQRSR